jgi:hypothetical protein
MPKPVRLKPMNIRPKFFSASRWSLLGADLWLSLVMLFFAPDSPAQTGADDRVPPSTSDFPARSMSAFLMVTWKTASLMVFGSTCGAGHTFLSQNDPVCLDFIRAPKSLTVLRACSGYVGKCASIR